MASSFGAEFSDDEDNGVIHPLAAADHAIQRAVTGAVSTVSSMLGMGDPVAKYDKNLPAGTGYVPEEHYDQCPLVPRSRFAVRPVYNDATDVSPDEPEEKVHKIRSMVCGHHASSIRAYLNDGFKLPCKWPLKAVDHRRVMDIMLVFTRTAPISSFCAAAGNDPLVLKIDDSTLQKQISDFLVTETEAYHFVPHCITVTDAQNQLPVPLSVNVVSKVPNSSEVKTWFVENHAYNTLGPRKSMLLHANHTGAINKVAFVGDESVLCTTSFCRWACVNYEEQLPERMKDDSKQWYTISIPESFTVAPTPLVHEIMRMWPRIRQESLAAIQAGRAGQLQPAQLITHSATGGYNLNIPVCVLAEHMHMLREATAQEVHLMQMRGVSLVVTPANQFGWDALPKSSFGQESLATSRMARLADPLATLTVEVKLTGTVVPRDVQE